MKIIVRNNNITIMKKICEELFPNLPDIEIKFLELSEREQKADDVKTVSLKTDTGYTIIIPVTELTPYAELPLMMATEIAHIADITQNPQNANKWQTKERDKLYLEIYSRYTDITSSIQRDED